MIGPTMREPGVFKCEPFKLTKLGARVGVRDYATPTTSRGRWKQHRTQGLRPPDPPLLTSGESCPKAKAWRSELLSRLSVSSSPILFSLFYCLPNPFPPGT